VIIEYYCNFRLSTTILYRPMKRFSAIPVIVSIIILICITPGCRQRTGLAGKARLLADSITRSMVPDRRVAVCDITVNDGPGSSLVVRGETSVPELAKAIRNTLNKITENLIDSILILPDTTLNKRYLGLVSLSVINIRKEPDHAAELVTQALMGTPVRILKEDGGWYLVQTPDSYIGWAEDASVASMDIHAMKKWKASGRSIFLGNYGNILARPEPGATVSDIVAGCIVERAGESGFYLRVVLPDGRTGFLPAASCMDFKEWMNKSDCTEKSVVSCAGRFLGLPYLWGGTSIKGVDCSGFSKTVYFLNGKILSRDASQQALHGIDIDISKGYKEFRPGDLLFFGKIRDGKKRISHVAIYIGDSEYIHSSGLVRINSLDSTRGNFNRYREVSMLQARRIIGSENDPFIVNVRQHPWY
jgi:SH3-like domain-containing protein